MYASICHSCSAPSGDVGGSLEMTAKCVITSCSILHPNCHRLYSKWIFKSLKTLRTAAAGGAAAGAARNPEGTPMQMFSYSFWLLVSFSDKTKTNKHPVRQQAKQLAGDGWHRDRDRERRREDRKFFFLFSSADFHSEWECGLGVDLWPTISLHLSIFCLPMADKIDRIHRYFMMQEDKLLLIPGSWKRTTRHWGREWRKTQCTPLQCKTAVYIFEKEQWLRDKVRQYNNTLK